MLLGFGYLYKFFFFFFQKAENSRIKKSVGQNFVILLLYIFFIIA